MPKDKLFKEITWGVTPGGHVAHILKDGDGIAIDEGKPFDPREVSHDEIFINDADNITKKHFIALAQKAEDDYGLYGDDKGVSQILHTIKDYLTADNRRDQQAKLKLARKQIQTFLKTIDKNSNLSSVLMEYENTFANLTNGTLTTKGVTSVNVKENGKIDDPSATVSNRIGTWRKTDDVLFPHEPSPNDIKQGLGADDCFMLSGLTKIAANHPEKIKNAMRDNGDGTVTVRFYDFYGAQKINNGKKPEEQIKKQPVYITVNKSVRKAVGFINAYTSGSLWVQLFEKAYVTYRNTVEAKHATGETKDKLQDGYYAIDRSYPDNFLNAFLEDDYLGQTVIGCGKDISDNLGNSLLTLYDLDSSGKPVTARGPGYCKYEKALFDFLKPNVNKGEVITVGNATSSKVREHYLNSHGIRIGHAYTVLKCFEKEVDGQIKKYVQVRDPYAVYSAKYDDNGRLVNSSHEITKTFKAGAENMGTFNLEISDFCMMFSSINGIKKSLSEEFDAINANFTMDDFVVEAPEMAIQRNKGENPILDVLDEKDGFDRIKTSLKTLASDLAATDEWYISTNTQEFRDMKKSLYALEKQFKEFAAEKRMPTMAERNKISDAFTDLQKKTKIYAEKKEAKNNDPKEKAPSNRALYRLETAKNILELCNGKADFFTTKADFRKNLGMTVKGIQESLTTMNQDKNSDNLVTNGGKNKSHVVLAAKQAEQLINKDNSLIDGEHLTQKDLADLKKQRSIAEDSGFEVIDIDAPAKEEPAIALDGFELVDIP